jgi:predicted RND superfamily exporter protein
MIPYRWVEAYLRFLLRRRIAVTVIIALMTVFFAWQCTHIKVLPQFLDFYPGPLKLSFFGKEVTVREGHPYIRIYNEFRRMFGSANILTVIIEKQNGNIYNPKTLQKVATVTKELTETKGVVPYQILSIAHPKMKSITNAQGAIQIREVFYPKIPETQEDADRVKFAVYSTKGIRGLYVSQDDTSALVTAGFWEEELDFNYLYDRLNEIKASVEDENHKVYITGFPWLYTSIQRYVPEVGEVFVVTVAALTFLLWNYFRSWPGVWVPVFSGILSSIWALGMVPLLGLNLDPLVLVIPIFLSARALSHSVQSMDRYHEE